MSPRLQHLGRAAVSVVAAVTLLGCDAIQSGKRDTLEFRLDTDDRLFPASFGTPLASGLEIDVLAFDKGSAGQSPAVVSLAQSRNQGVARVSATDGHRITIAGRAPGVAEIEVVAAAGDDAFDLTVADIARVDLTYPGVLLVPETPPVRVAQGGTTRFGVTLKDGDGRALVGYGSFPVELSPASAGSVRATHDVAHLSVNFSETGAVSLQPRGAAALDVTVLPVSDITALTLESTAGTVKPEQSVLAIARGATDAGERVVGLSGLVTVTSVTEATCTVEETPKLGDTVFTVTGKAPGDCRLTATLGGLSAEVTISVSTP